jgi:cell division protein ZapA
VLDELSELQKRVKGLETEIEALRKSRDDALSKADSNDAAMTTALGDVADRIDGVARKLEAGEA